MVGTVGGSVLFTGATGSWRGAAGHAAFAAAKAGLRMVAQSLAREYGPAGVARRPHRNRRRGGTAIAYARAFPIRRPSRARTVCSTSMPSPRPTGRSTVNPPAPGTFEIDLRPFKEHF